MNEIPRTKEEKNPRTKNQEPKKRKENQKPKKRKQKDKFNHYLFFFILLAIYLELVIWNLELVTCNLLPETCYLKLVTSRSLTNKLRRQYLLFDLSVGDRNKIIVILFRECDRLLH